MWFRRDSEEGDLDDEIRAHLDMETARRMDAGETYEDARRNARRDFGNQTQIKEVTRDMWGHGWVTAFFQDMSYAFRGMRKSPGFAIAAVLTIGLGIGASTAVFSVVNGILLRPLPYPQAERVVMLWMVAPLAAAFKADDYPWSKIGFRALASETKVFDAVGAFEPDTFNLTGSGEPVMLDGIRASEGFFRALGVAPALGRFYTAGEDQPGRERVVVLGDRLWRERFSADPHIVGRAIALSGYSYTVIGVMPPGFAFPHAGEMPASLEFPREAQLWAPLAIAPGEAGVSDLAVIARLKPGQGLAQAQAELDVFAGTLLRIYPAAKGWTRSRAVPLHRQVVGDTEKPLWLLLGAAGLVLAIACSNVAGLVLTRSLGRRREFTLRAALGAGNGRLLRQILAENLALALAGGVVGFALASAGVRFVRDFGPSSLPRFDELSLDPRALAFCSALTLVTGILFGLAPGLGSGRGSLADSLRSGGRAAGSAVSPRLRNILIVGQIALALMLVAGAALLGRTFYGLMNTDRGFGVDRVLTFEISLPPLQYPDPDRMAKLYTRALDTVRGVPGVVSAGLAHAVPMGGAPDATGIRVPGRQPKPNERPYANYMFASPGYFGSTHTPLLAGRDFLPTDTLDSIPVTIVNRAMAEALWPGESAIGKQVGVGLTRYPARVVVGVVANVKQNSLREETAPQMYVPYTQNEIKVWPPMQTMQFAVRTMADPGAMTERLRQAMHGVDPALPLARVATLETLVDRSLTQPRFAMLLVAAFSSIALLLAAVGMYGVIAHSVAQRTAEIGVRMALGASRSRILSMVLAQGARLAAAGIAIGLAGALLGARAMAGLLYGVRPGDPVTFCAVAILLALTALLACYLPARRAIRVDPAVALRNE